MNAQMRVVFLGLVVSMLSTHLAAPLAAQMSPQHFAWVDSVLRSNHAVRAVNLTPSDQQFMGSPMPGLSGVVRSLRSSSRSENVNKTVDGLLAEVQPLQQAGNNSEVRRKLMHAWTLLQRKSWDSKAEFGASLSLRGAPAVLDLSKPLAGQLIQTFPARPESSSALRLRLSVGEFALDDTGLLIDNPKIVKSLGTFNGVSNDLTARPFPFSASLAGVPEGVYRLIVEVLDGDVSVGTTVTTVWFVRDMEARRVQIEKQLAGVQRHDSAKATIRYPFELAERINSAKHERSFFDFAGQIQRSVELTQALAGGKDPVARAKGYQTRHYSFSEAKEIVPYRLYVPTNWDGVTKLPMVTLLHGANEDERDMLERDGGFFQRIAERRGYILVAPIGYRINGAYGTLRFATNTPNAETIQMTEFSEKDVMNVTELVAKEYDVDRSRMYIMGQSMGGRGTQYLGRGLP
jgi:hypothetical protein